MRILTSSLRRLRPPSSGKPSHGSQGPAIIPFHSDSGSSPEARSKMRYRLPLELELCILELAAPPFEIDSLPHRVNFIIKISLVHRSLTAWAQDRLRDQFLYTYRPRRDEYKRLKERLEAGFGRDRRLRRLYLDLTRLPKEAHLLTAPDIDSISIPTVGRASVRSLPISEPSNSAQDGARALKDEVVRFVQLDNAAPNDGYWELSATITSYCQALDTLWLKPPIPKLDLRDLPRAPAIESVADRYPTYRD